MGEYSRILIEQYCWYHNSAKSRRLEKLARKSYDINAAYTDADGIFMEKVIVQEKDERPQEAFRDLVDFMFGY